MRKGGFIRARRRRVGSCANRSYRKHGVERMNYAAEFATVDAVLQCEAATCGVDAFALSVIKAERQMRKLFTFLVFQAPAFRLADVPHLRKALSDNRKVYLDGFIKGWDALYPSPVSSLVGKEYQRLWSRLDEATRHRNKIFHGQLTNDKLSKPKLLDYVSDVRNWCSRLAQGAESEVGYDGFGRNSFRKSATPDLGSRLLEALESVADYKRFIQAKMERP
jgi:hypothetical protein